MFSFSASRILKTAVLRSLSSKSITVFLQGLFLEIILFHWMCYSFMFLYMACNILLKIGHLKNQLPFHIFVDCLYAGEDIYSSSWFESLTYSLAFSGYRWPLGLWVCFLQLLHYTTIVKYLRVSPLLLLVTLAVYCILQSIISCLRCLQICNSLAIFMSHDCCSLWRPLPWDPSCFWLSELQRRWHRHQTVKQSTDRLECCKFSPLCFLWFTKGNGEWATISSKLGCTTLGRGWGKSG